MKFDEQVHAAIKDDPGVQFLELQERLENVLSFKLAQALVRLIDSGAVVCRYGKEYHLAP